jgi:hypothetical protein
MKEGKIFVKAGMFTDTYYCKGCNAMIHGDWEWLEHHKDCEYEKEKAKEKNTSSKKTTKGRKPKDRVH